WLVVANADSSNKNYSITIRDREGSQLLTLSKSLGAYAQQHFYLNPVIDPHGVGAAGSATLGCANAGDKLLVQSAFYGSDADSGSIGWAYSVLPLHQASGAVGMSASINTYLGAANWLEMANLASTSQNFSLSLNGASPARASVNASRTIGMPP